MQVREKTKCRQPSCECTVVQGQEFCSPYCESGVAKSLPREPCRCGHPACEETSRAEPRASAALRPEHYLVLVDESEATEKAVDYLCSLLEALPGDKASVTLFHVLRVPPELVEHGGAENPDEEIRRERALAEKRKSWLTEAERGARPLLDRVTTALTRAHVPRERIQERFSTDVYDEIGRDALESALENGCGTILVGRRSFPWYREITHRHVADDLVEHAKAVAVCVVR